MKCANKIVALLLRLGLPMGPQALLTVSGRKTGLPRTTPVALNPGGGGWVLVSVWGRVDWVKNLQAAGSAVVTMRRRSVPVVSRQMADEQAAPILRDLLASLNPLVRPFIGPQFHTALGAPLEVWLEEAKQHPVFHLTPA
jgi:deazaflavin-dependent oxidoreductase (nitroreductase family)